MMFPLIEVSTKSGDSHRPYGWDCRRAWGLPIIFIRIAQVDRDRRVCTESWSPVIADLHLQHEARLLLKIESTAAGHGDLPARGINSKDSLPRPARDAIGQRSPLRIYSDKGAYDSCNGAIFCHGKTLSLQHWLFSDPALLCPRRDHGL